MQQENLNIHKWVEIVREVIHKHPEWVAETNGAINHGIQQRLSDEVIFRAEAETALSICYDSLKDGKIPAHQKDMVVNTIKNSKLLGGTLYAQKL